jgi:hypothetical protein
LFDAFLCGVELEGSFIRIDSISNLVVARLVQTSQVEPYLADVGVQPDSSGIGIKSVSVLVDLVIQNTDRAPECRVSTVSVNGLLVGLVGFVVSLGGHVSSSEEVPALSVVGIWTSAYERNLVPS